MSNTTTNDNDSDGGTFLHLRSVDRRDKARWVRASRADARKHKTLDTRGNLSGWVIKTLNAAVHENSNGK